VSTIFTGLATTIPIGKLSDKFNELATAVLAVLSIVNVRVLEVPAMITVGENALVTTGGGLTLKVSVDGPLLPKDEVKSPLVLTKSPAALDVTSA
jgi:hypothetical protein